MIRKILKSSVLPWVVLVLMFGWMAMAFAQQPPVIRDLTAFVALNSREFEKLPCPCGGHDTIAESFASGHPCGVCISVAQSALRQVLDGHDWGYINKALHNQFDPVFKKMIGRTLPKRLLP